MIFLLPFSLFYVIWAFLLIFSIGDFILQKVKFNFFSENERIHFAVILGSLALICIIYTIGYLGLLKRWVLLLVAFCLFGLFIITKKYKIFFQAIKEYLSNLTLNERRYLIGYFLIIVVLIIYCFTPSVAFDELGWHFLFPRRWINEGKIYHDILERYEQFYPTGVWSFYALGFIVDNTGATSKLFLVIFNILIFSVVYSFTYEVFNIRIISIVSSILFTTMPVIGNFTGTAYPDLASCYFSIVSWWLIYKFLVSGSIIFLILSGVATGIACLSKYNGISVMIIILIVLLFFSKNKLYSLTYFLFSFFLVFWLYLIRNYIVTGNPFYPFKVFGLNYCEVFVEFNKILNKVVFKPYHPITNILLALPKFSSHSVGMNFVLFPICVIRGLFKREKKIFFLFSLYMLYMFINTYISKYSDVKYYLPGFIWLAMMVSWLINDLFVKETRKFFIVLLIISPNLLYFLGLAYLRIPLFLGYESKEKFIARKYPGSEEWEVVEWCNRNFTYDQNIIYFDKNLFSPAAFYYNSKVYYGERISFLQMPIQNFLGILKSRKINYAIEIKGFDGKVLKIIKKHFQIKKVFETKRAKVYKLNVIEDL
ncbi:MAG: glycosyltransferase family 39 protein [Elusimicrobiota bacterium]|nr:glycosyltransferase family 39 protein [Endomicrobiia bacterium]MDW8166436.1 glycosyltransferase family 39 protein [Elusimicrobiota bacterium]